MKELILSFSLIPLLIGIPEFLESGRNSWTLDSGCWTLDAGLWTLDSGRWTLNSGPWTLHLGSKALGTKHSCRQLELSTGSKQNQNPVSGSSYSIESVGSNIKR